MQCMSINKQKLYYALYEGKEEIVDEYGNKTGNYTIQYSDPVEAYMNISPARGTSDVEQFGINTNYTNTLITDDMACPIAEDSVLWIGKNVEESYNYMVVAIAKSINSITIAVRKVDVS